MENQIVEAINYIKKISNKKPSIDRLLAHINNTTANNWDREFVEDTLHELRVRGVIDEQFKILSADNAIISASNETAPLPGHPLTPVPAKSASTQTQTTPVSPISNEQPTDFIVNDANDEQIYNLNAEVKALKSFIVEQLYVIKKSIEDIKCQGSIPNSSDLLQSLKEELSYLRSENLNKTSIIKSLTETIVFLLILIQLYFHQICITKKCKMKNTNLQQISYMIHEKQMAKVLLIYMKSRAKEIKKSIKI